MLPATNNEAISLAPNFPLRRKRAETWQRARKTFVAPHANKNFDVLALAHIPAAAPEKTASKEREEEEKMEEERNVKESKETRVTNKTRSKAMDGMRREQRDRKKRERKEWNRERGKAENRCRGILLASKFLPCGKRAAVSWCGARITLPS